MKETVLGSHLRKVPSIAVGCMRLSEKSKDEMNHSSIPRWNRAHISLIMLIFTAAA